MEGPQRRDINELLANGYFKTSRAKSPSASTPTSTNSPSFLRAYEPETSRARSRSRSRAPRGPPPPRPTVEDELVSLAKESSASPRPSYDPPLRGKIDQNPILLEADVTAVEAARLQNIPVTTDKDDNGERRFVLIPKSDTYDPNEKDEIVHRKDEIRNSKATKQEAPRQARAEQRYDTLRQDSLHPESPRREDRKTRPRSQTQTQREERESRPVIHQDPRKKEEDSRRRTERTDSGRPIVHQESQRRDERKDSARPPIERRRSRQDLPALETKVPREIPPQFRRSASAFASLQDKDETPKASTPRGSATEYFLSPEVIRGKDTLGGAPRQQVHDLLWGKAGTPVSEKRNSGSLSRPGTPNSEKRNSGSFEPTRNPTERLTRPQQLSEEFGTQKSDRHPSSDRSGRSSRSSTHRGYYSSSDEDIAPESDVEKHRKKHHRHHREEHRRKSPSRVNSRPLDLRPSSKLNSPLPSPKVSPSQIPRGDEFERRETFPQSHDRRPTSRPVSPLSPDRDTPRPDRLNPFEPSARPKSRQSNTAPNLTPSAHHASLPIPIPSRIELSNLESRRPIQQSDDKPNGPRPQPSSWQPPAFSPPSQNLEKPVGSYRRYSEDIERGSIAPLPSCPRTTFTRGRNDWLTLPHCPSFDICPSCFNSTIAPTEYKKWFVSAPRRSPDTEVLCDFGSSPWYRIAWLITVKERRKDLNLFYSLADIAATTQPCLGKHEAVRPWHSVVDPKTGGLVRGFDVCYNCVKSVETLLPAIRGVFFRNESRDSTGSARVCDFRFDSKRFVQYFDALETAADRADYDDAPPDTRDLVSLAKRFARFDECRQDMELTDRKWHIITQLPEFTVCEECFDEVVWPELEEEKAIPMMFNKTLQRLPKASCQLYSAKMRGIFRLASDSGDYKMLASKARERKGIELEYKANMTELRKQAKVDPSAQREIYKLEDDWRRWE